MTVIRLLLADDHPVVRDGLRGMLASEADFEVVAEAASGAEAVRLTERERPDVVLMDLQMPEMDGATATAEIAARFPATRVLVLTTYDADADILRAVEAGATGYLLKDTPQRAAVPGHPGRRPGRDGAGPDGGDPAGQPHAPAGLRGPHRPRGRGPGAGRQGLEQRRHRRRPVHQRGHGQDPPAAHLRQTGRGRPDRRRGGGAGARHHRPPPAAPADGRFDQRCAVAPGSCGHAASRRKDPA